MKVLKFGGTSIGNIERIGNVISIIERAAKEGEVAVVLSAFEGVTNQLIMLAQQAQVGDDSWKENFQQLHDYHIETVQKLIEPKEQTPVLSELKKKLNDLEDALRGISLLRGCSLRSLDIVMSFGERFSSFIVTSILRAKGMQAFYVDARKVILTDDNYGNAKVYLKETYAQIQDYLQGQKGIPVMTGFIGTSKTGITTTIGRSGSDYTASILGAALKAKQIQIWTDVDGVMSADPRRVKDAFVLDQISYEEAMELSHFGAKVIHPHTMPPAIKAKIPILIKNTFNPDHPGTKISKESSEKTVVVGISSIDNAVLLNVEGGGMKGIPGIAQRLFGALASFEISVIFIAQASSEQSICFAVPERDEEDAAQVLKEEFALEIQVGHVKPVQIIRDISILAAVGSNMSGHTGTAGTLFRALGENNINIVAIAQGLSELNISFIVRRGDTGKALNVVHQAFFLSKQKHIHLFCVGVGTIGGELLKQIKNQQKYLKEELHLKLNVVALANSKKMIFDEEEIALENWEEKLEKNSEDMNLEQFVNIMKKFKKSHSIFVDNTASDQVPHLYEEILRAHIPIVTPNKKFNARSYSEYKRLRDIERETGTGFYYETNVGAGLPIIETMKALQQSGDEIKSIEGILSGTLSFIFNSFDGSKSFSEIVKMAQEKGYTEPDPREDLCGLDVARKLLILAREMGIKLELKDIKVENLVPPNCRVEGSIDEFFKKLKNEDNEFEKRLKAAQSEDAVLRYVGKIEDGKTSVSLQKVPRTHPFASLRGSDNVVSLTTRRYSETPLIVQGPGAGPGVTAAGVFADIIRAAHHFS